MNYQETCSACDKAYKTCQVDNLREAATKAFNASGEAKAAYLNARNAYHRIYRQLWDNFNNKLK